MRQRHPDKDVEKALQFAEANGWTVAKRKGGAGHAWGRAICPDDSCSVAIWSTPRNSGDHANDIRRAIRRCPH